MKYIIFYSQKLHETFWKQYLFPFVMPSINRFLLK